MQRARGRVEQRRARQVLLGHRVEPRVLDRHRPLRGQAREQAHLALGEGVRLEVGAAQHPEDLVADQDRRGREGPRGVGPRHRRRVGPRVHEARIREPVAGPHRPALRVGAPGHALARPEQERAREVHRVVAAPLEHEAAARGVPPVEAGRPASEGLDDPVRDEIDHLVQLERGGELAGDFQENDGVLLALAGLAVEARVVDRGGELLAEELEVGDAPPRDGPAARLVVGADEPDRPPLDEERHQREAPRAQHRVGVELLGQRRHLRELLVVAHHERDARVPHHLEAAAAPERDEPPDVGAHVAARHQAQGDAVILGEPDVEAVEAERAVRGGREDLHALLQVHGTIHGLGQRVEILGELPPVLDVLEEARLGDRGGRLADEDLEQLPVVGAETERRVAAEHQHAQQEVLEDDRDAEEAREPALSPPLPIGRRAGRPRCRPPRAAAAPRPPSPRRPPRWPGCAGETRSCHRPPRGSRGAWPPRPAPTPPPRAPA